MNWQSKLRLRSRDPAYLWRMVIGILGAGIIVGWLAPYLGLGSPLDPTESFDNTGMKQIESQAEQGQWWDVWWAVPLQIYNRFSQPGIVVLASLAAGCWLAILLQTMRIRNLADWRLCTALAGVGAGALSIWPTAFLNLWQEYAWQLRESEELLAGLRFFILGVGLREEVAKLLCLLPLMIILVRQRDELAALVISGCVGLGFAVIENLNYYLGSLATATMGRFLTANPLHIALTGLIGLNVYRALRDPKNWAPQAVAMFCLMVLAHGGYDAFSLPDLAEYSMGSMIVFALVMYQFFHEIRDLRPRNNDIISLSATFLAGVSVLAAATFIYLSSVAGPRVAADTLVSDIIGTAMMVYLFLREMPETLVRM